MPDIIISKSESEFINEPDAFEPNNSPLVATDLGTGSVQIEQLSIDGAADDGFRQIFREQTYIDGPGRDFADFVFHQRRPQTGEGIFQGAVFFLQTVYGPGDRADEEDPW